MSRDAQCLHFHEIGMKIGEEQQELILLEHHTHGSSIFGRNALKV